MKSILNGKSVCAFGSAIRAMMTAATARLNANLILSALRRRGVESSSNSPSPIAVAEYPESSTACLRSAIPVTPWTYSTVARSVARLTDADSTPSTPVSACSTCETHAAHVIPSMPRVTLRVPTPYPASSTASLRVARLSVPLPGRIGSNSDSVAFSVARFTATSSTPSTDISASETWETQAAHVMPVI